VIEDLCFHIVDVVQNSVTAGADRVEVVIEATRRNDRIRLEICDNGRGMDAETAQLVQDPFYTTKSGKKVGLGIPLMKETALQCDGAFRLTSESGKGTRIRAEYRLSHIDTPPMGPVVDTVFQLIAATPEVNIVFAWITDAGSFRVSTREIREQIGDMSLSHPAVLSFLRDYLRENIHNLPI
jgi:signal transduction histidine kinase